MKFVCPGKCESLKKEEVKYTINTKDGVEVIYKGLHTSIDDSEILAIIKPELGVPEVQYIYNNSKIDNLTALSRCTACYCIRDKFVFEGNSSFNVHAPLYQLQKAENKSFVININNEVKYTVFNS